MARTAINVRVGRPSRVAAYLAIQLLSGNLYARYLALATLVAREILEAARQRARPQARVR